MAYLILIRHGKSEYNEKGLWTGHANPPLNDEGIEEAKFVANHLRDIPLDYAYSSAQDRSRQTLSIILKTLLKDQPTPLEALELNERDYGIYTGKNKWQIKDELGNEEFMKLRRSWDYPIPEGESLKQVSERTVPFFEREILPKLCECKNVLVVSSGNALRTIIKHLEKLSDENIANIEFATGEAVVYVIDKNGRVTQKQVRAHHANNV